MARVPRGRLRGAGVSLIVNAMRRVRPPQAAAGFLVIAALAGVLVGATLLAAARAYDLPEVGDPAAAALKPSEERRLGEVLRVELRATLPLVHDIELNAYIQSLGSRLGASEKDFHFLLVNDKRINAFATPGGVIAVNSGLLLAAETESELAGVLAHEISHVEHRHLARLLALSRHDSWLHTFGLVAAILGGVYNSDLALAGAHLTQGLALERRFSYTQSFEHEADAGGQARLASAGFSPAGMPAFFARLARREGESRAPEFLRTHPLTAERLERAQERAARLGRGQAPSDTRFHFAAARLAALLDPRDFAHTEDATPLGLYRRAVAMTASGSGGEAARLLADLPEKSRSIEIGLALAQARLARGDAGGALAEARRLRRLYPRHPALLHIMAGALIRQGRARAALDTLNDIADRAPALPELFRRMGEAAEASGNARLAQEFLADYYAANGRLPEALKQLGLAEQGAPRAARERIAAKRERITALLQGMKK